MNKLKYILLPLLTLFISFPAYSGDFSIEAADNLSGKPTGKYVDDLEEANIECKSMRLNFKYTFDFGLILGREELSGCSYIKESSTEEKPSPKSQYLFVKSRNFIVGLGFGEVIRFSIEAGIPGNARVYLSDNILEGAKENANRSQGLDSQWLGATLDWGFMNNDGSDFGLLLALRQLDASTDNLFGTGKKFKAQATHFSTGIRYRY